MCGEEGPRGGDHERGVGAECVRGRGPRGVDYMRLSDSATGSDREICMQLGRQLGMIV